VPPANTSSAGAVAIGRPEQALVHPRRSGRRSRRRPLDRGPTRRATIGKQGGAVKLSWIGLANRQPGGLLDLHWCGGCPTTAVGHPPPHWLQPAVDVPWRRGISGGNQVLHRLMMLRFNLRPAAKKGSSGQQTSGWETTGRSHQTARPQPRLLPFRQAIDGILAEGSINAGEGIAPLAV